MTLVIMDSDSRNMLCHFTLVLLSIIRHFRVQGHNSSNSQVSINLILNHFNSLNNAFNSETRPLTVNYGDGNDNYELFFHS